MYVYLQQPQQQQQQYYDQADPYYSDTPSSYTGYDKTPTPNMSPYKVVPPIGSADTERVRQISGLVFQDVFLDFLI